MVAPRVIPLFYPALFRIKHRGGNKNIGISLINMVSSARVHSSHSCVTFESDTLMTGSVILKCHLNLLLLSPGYNKIDISILDHNNVVVFSFPIKVLFDDEPRSSWMF